MGYKWCVVPQCTSTSIKTPHKMFVLVPKNPKKRKKWLKLAKRDPNSVKPNSNVYMCEDHLDMEKHVTNYVQYKMGFSKRILLSDAAVPSKFHCQGKTKKVKRKNKKAKRLLDAEPQETISLNGNGSKSNTETQDPLENIKTEPDEAVQCRFCGEFSHDCIAVYGHMPYIAGHKTTLAINHIRIELDFSNESLPTTVCRQCDTKLQEICEFVKQVNTAQFSLVTVSQKVNNQIVKAEFHENDDIDALTITEEEYMENTTIKRKSDDKGKTSKKKAKTVETEFIIDIDIKEEIIDDVKRKSPEYSDTETDVKPSESELANSALVYRMSETSDRCNLTKSSKNSEIGNSALVYQMSETSDRCNLTKSSRNSEIGNSVIDKGLNDKT